MCELSFISVALFCCLSSIFLHLPVLGLAPPPTLSPTNNLNNPHAWFPDENLLNFPESKRRNVPTVIVAQDGSGQYRTIQEGLDASKRIPGRVAIHIKKGEYYEYIEIGEDRMNLFLIGDGIGKTIITGNRSQASGCATWESATVKVDGKLIAFKDMTIRNTAGLRGGQAVALMSSADRSAYYRCSFEGYQDTLYLNKNRQFIGECLIYGTIDFIFGDSRAVIHNSTLYGRAPNPGEAIVITAQGRQKLGSNGGFSIMNSRYLPDPSNETEVRKFKAALGRTWMNYSRVIYINTYLDGMIDPTGWWEMTKEGDNNTRSTVYYAEYNNYGPGSSTSGRVKWPGFKLITDVQEALQFTPTKFIDALSWLPRLGVPFPLGL